MRDLLLESITLAIDNQAYQHIIGKTELRHNTAMCGLTAQLGKSVHIWDYMDGPIFEEDEPPQYLEFSLLDLESYFAAQSTQILQQALAEEGLCKSQIVAFVKVYTTHSGSEIRRLECDVVSATGTINKTFNLLHIPREFNYLPIEQIASMIIDSGLGDFPMLIGELKTPV